jgi:hypothetical protein
MRAVCAVDHVEDASSAEATRWRSINVTTLSTMSHWETAAMSVKKTMARERLPRMDVRVGHE